MSQSQDPQSPPRMPLVPVVQPSQGPGPTASTEDPEGALGGVATGVEGLTRGLLGQGAAAISHAAGAGPEYEARAKQHPAVAAASEAVGEMARDIAGYAVAGPAALVANATLNLVGRTADEAYRHDPALSREHVLMGAAQEAFGALLGAAVPMGITALKPAGRWVAGTAVKAGERMVPSYLRGLVAEAMDRGVFGTGRRNAVAVLSQEAEKASSGMQKLLGMADHGLPDAQRPLEDFLSRHAPLLKGPQAKAVSEAAYQASRGTAEGYWMAEQGLRATLQGAQKKADGAAASQLGGLLAAVSAHNDGAFARRGVNVEALRELAEHEASSRALASQAVELPEIDYAGAAREFGRRAVTGGIKASIAAHVPVVGPYLGAALGLESAQKAGKAIAKVAGPSVAQGAYDVGKAAARAFDGHVFFQWLGAYMGEEADKAAAAVVGGVFAPVARFAAQAYVQALTAAQDQRQAVLRRSYDSLGDLPLPESAKDFSVQDLDNLFKLGQQVLPGRGTSGNPLAPPSSRRLSLTESVQVSRRMHAAVRPLDELRDPTPEGLETVRQLYPDTYQTYVQGILRRTGPNMPATHPARPILDRLGLTSELSKTGAVVQQLHRRPSPPPPGGQATRRPQETTRVNVQNAPTAGEKMQERELSGQ